MKEVGVDLEKDRFKLIIEGMLGCRVIVGLGHVPEQVLIRIG